MTRSPEVPLEQRRAEYADAESRAETAAAVYLTARAGGQIPANVLEEMDAAQAALRKARRRLEDTERRLARRARENPNGQETR